MTSLLIVSGFISLTHAKASFKRYGMQSAIINYNIKGSGKITENSRLDVEGRATLLFTEWGARKLFKEKITETTIGAGAIKNTKIKRTLFIEDRGTVYRADFQKLKVEKREDPLMKLAISSGKNLYRKAMDDLMTKGTKVGSSVVMGYSCEEWQYQGKKRCYYKGVPLKEESTLSGIQLVKVAVEIGFDKKIPEDAFALPDLALDEQKGYLMKKEKTKLYQGKHIFRKGTEKPASGMEEQGIDTNNSKSVSGSSVKKVSNVPLTENIFKEQKNLLPKMLAEMQEARVCLENADNKNEANQCIARMLEIKEEMTGEKDMESEISIWTDIAKEETMDKLEENIMDMKRRMPCIRRSRNFNDLSMCMQ